MLYEIYITIMIFIETGGNVLWLIAALTFLMWSMVFERIWYFMFEHRRVLAETSQQWESRPERRSWSAQKIRDALVSEASAKITGPFPLIQACVSLAPLCGLLGTVTGMIAVFEAMAMHGGGDARAMASGVSQATIPTMAGMVVALSGIFATTLLKRRIDFEIELFEDHLTMDH